MRATDRHLHVVTSGDAIGARVQAILRRGRRPRNRAERQAERAVAYGDHLQALVDEIREATATRGRRG